MSTNIIPFKQQRTETSTAPKLEIARESIGFVRKKFYNSIHWKTKRIDGDYGADHYRVSVEKQEFEQWCSRNDLPSGKLPRNRVDHLGAVAIVLMADCQSLS
jgi:hypothetical protein